MKFHTAILSLAILGTLNNNNNSHYVDAKIWTLRGLGRSTNNNNNNNNNNNDVIQGGSLINKQEEQSAAAAVPTNHKNLGDYLFGERNLGKDKKKKGGGKKMKGEESVVEVTVVETEEEGGKDGKKKKGEGKKTEKTGDDIFIDAPADVREKYEACDADEEEVGGTGRRILKKKKGKKEDKKTMSDGVCDRCEYEDDDEEGDEESGLAKAVEASDPSCDPDDVECTEEDDDSVLPPEDRSPDDEEEEGGEDFEAIERHLMDPRRLTGNTAGIGQFTPLTCNPEVFDCSSAPGSLATLVANAAGGEVKVPCGQCYEYDLGEEVTIGGLNIVGKLLVPTNYKSTLTTPYVVVQGELEMSDTNPISEDNTSMKIVLTGTTDVMWTPEEAVDGMSTLNLGEKAFLVAGGKLNIRAWDEPNGNTWTPLIGMAEAERVYLDPITSPPEAATKALDPPAHISDPSIQCPTQIVHDFENGFDGSVWTGGDGGVVDYDEENGVLIESNISRDWQGFRLDFTKLLRDCPLIAGATYLVTIRLKIDDPALAPDGITDCAKREGGCPRLYRKMMFETGDKYNYKEVSRGNIGLNGEWFIFATEWTWTAEDLVNNEGMIFFLERFPDQSTIYMDEFQFELPSSKSYPVENDPCFELVVNGDAENADGRGWHPFPMWTHDYGKYNPKIMEEAQDDGTINKFWRISGRGWHGDSPRFNINHECLSLNYKYTASLKVRFTGPLSHSSRYWFEIKGLVMKSDCTVTDSEDCVTRKYNKPLQCDAISPADGWVHCSGDFIVTEDYLFLERPEIIFVSQDENDNTGYHGWDFDDISIQFKNGPAEGIEIDGAVAERWGANSDVHITSTTLQGKDSQNARVVEVSSTSDGNAVLNFAEGIGAALTEKDTPGQGVEVAIMTRNIKIVGEDDGTYNGGYLQVFHTPGVQQLIEGVEFMNMGQPGRKNRFPMQLLYNGVIEGTSLSRNSFRENKSRCISVDGTANTTIAANVASDTMGHCFYFSHESADNMVVGNLISNQKKQPTKIDGYDDYESDAYAIWSPANHFIGNVAAGGWRRGFRYYLNWKTLGEDLIRTGGSLRKSPIGMFKDNKAHSNYREGFHLSSFEKFFGDRDPVNTVTFENLSAYRNGEQGVYVYNCVHCKFIGGFLSENFKGIEVDVSDGVTIEDFVIEGQTQKFKDVMELQPTGDQPCRYSSWDNTGLDMMGTKWRYGHKDPKYGLRLRNVKFSGFDREQEFYPCKSTQPITMRDRTNYGSHFDYMTSFSGVTVDDGRGMIINGCDADTKGFPDVVINDIDGSLDPDNSASSGALVSDKPYMTGLFDCKSVEGCMSYCTGMCLRMFSIFTERFGTESYKLRVTDTATGLVVDIPGHARSYSERWNTYAYDGQRVFSASLPAGKYTAEFIDESGSRVWPVYTEEQWEQEPDCGGGVTLGDVTWLKPTIDVAAQCAELVRNGASANRTESIPYIHTKWYDHKTLEVKPGEGMDGGNPIYMYNRKHHWTGIGQNLMSLCTEALEGRFFEFSAWMKMTDLNGNPATNIDPNIGYNSGTMMTMNERKYRNEATKDYLYNSERRDLAQLVRPYKPDEWNLVHGIFKMPPTLARLWFELERAPDNVNLMLDSASLSPFECSRDSLVSNGHFETGNSKFWDTWGEMVIDIVPGPNNGHALRSSARTRHSDTQAQVLDFDCVDAGERIAFSAKIKVEGEGMQDCDKYTWNQWGGNSYCASEDDGCTRCPDIILHTNQAGYRQYTRVAAIIADTPDDEGWHHAHGIHILNDKQTMADLTKIYFGDSHPKYNVITADVQAHVLEKNCQALVLNPDMAERDLFWSYTDRDRSKIKVIPGEGGSGHALRVYDRDSSWRGLKQDLDPRCIVPGEEFLITANFRLTNSTGHGVECDPNIQWNSNEGSQCPSVVVYGKGCPTRKDVYWQFWNAKSDKTWNIDGWNSYEALFEVNEELAACDVIQVYLHQVNRNWNLDVAYVQIAEKTTYAPTTTPTSSPTDLIDAGTSSPTEVPTAMPSLSSAMACPQIADGYVELLPGPVMLQRSSTMCIITKADVDANGTKTEVAPVARSSNGGDWEKHAGEFAESLLYDQEFADYDVGCQISLPELAPGQKYFIASYTDSSRRLSAVDEERKKLAHLLEQATFGTTLSALNEWTKGPVTSETVAEWIKEQMALPATSHRAYFRERANPRLTNPVRMGRNNHPCSANARWRRFTFTRKDGDRNQLPQVFEAVYNNGTDFDITITLNGFVRTTVKAIDFEHSLYAGSFEFNKEYVICGLPDERSSEQGGHFRLRMDDGACTHLKNPLVAFNESSTQPDIVLNIPNVSGSLKVIDAEHTEGEELINTLALTDELCDTLSDITEENDKPIHGKLPDGSYVLFDPRLQLEENTVEHPESDGGGIVTTLTGGVTKCANVPQTFKNEDSCVLSYSATACSSYTAPDIMIELNAENLGLLHTLTGQYAYSILGLPVVDYYGDMLESPCTPGLRSRWEIKAAGECIATTLGETTALSLTELLSESSDSNPYVRDIIFPSNGAYTCDSTDEPIAEVEIIIGSQCFQRVHQDHMGVFDFTYWTLNHTHPGNMVAMMEGESNPIKKWRDEYNSTFIVFPSFPGNGSDIPGHMHDHGDIPPHPLDRWVTYGEKFPPLGRFGDSARFVDLPNEMRTEDVAAQFGDASAEAGSGVVVCGSPNEVANDPTHGKYFVPVHERGTDWGLEDQKGDVISNIVVYAPDQLRQRVAFSLSQILVVVPAGTSNRDHTEAYANYHDIFVDNAFGNYRDILKETAFNAHMAEHLTYMQSKSTAHMWEHKTQHAFADENFSREIMQLFSTGLYLLNNDGSIKVDENGEQRYAYGNDEIMSFARAWTGFDYQQGRGNIEENSWYGNRIDPMRIEASWRDKFAKSDMTGGYIGDRYPLCVDLPEKMYLRKGAEYVLLGSNHMPKLVEDDNGFKNDLTLKKFELEAGSALKQRLCDADENGNCQYAVTVTLESNLNCFGKECGADTARVVGVGGGIYYEYVSPACVEQSFYNNAKKIIYKDRTKDSACADPRLPYASEACCSTADVAAYRSQGYTYDQERVTFKTAESRCDAFEGKQMCDFNYINDLEHHKKGYHWTTDSCKIQVKVDATGQVAIVYKPNSYNHLHPHIDPENRNFFKVFWDGEYPKNDNDGPGGNNCGYGACQSLQTGGCLCDTSVSESRVFSGMPVTAEEVLSQLTIGAYDTEAYDSGTYQEPILANGVTAFLKVGEEYTSETVFSVTDKYERPFLLKNSLESVQVLGNSTYSFRNAPSFMSVLNTEATAGKALRETDAVLDHYFYHDNTAIFIPIRMIQRMTTSNPSPKYIKTVADAFTTGMYAGIGSGKYGCMGAMVAAILLAPQARDKTMDDDPFDGKVVEPLLQLTRVTRGMETVTGDTVKLLYFDGLTEKIGQEFYEYETVFSFFLPEYKPDATTKAAQATLVAPEVVALDAPKTVGLLNGMFSFTKFGLNRCNQGFNNWWGSCTENEDFSSSYAHFTHTKPWITQEDAFTHAAAVVEELSLILTAGRLNPLSKDIITNAYATKLPVSGDAAAHRLALQLILTTPEFHTSQIAIPSGLARPEPAQPSASGVPYKAVVMTMLSGGADSFNMIIPHTCTDAKDMYQDYKDVRLQVAMEKEDLIPLNDVSNQICEKFGLHPRYENVASMFNSGEASWFVNIGQLDKETDKYNYWKDTKTRLFAHNHMQQAAQRVDPNMEAFTTGVLGRMRDSMKQQGLNSGGFSINSSAAATNGMPGVNPSAVVLNSNGVVEFNKSPSDENMMTMIKELNQDMLEESGVFADLWADHLTSALATNEKLYETMSTKTTTVDFPNSHLGRQLETVSKMIDTRNERGADRDVFYTSTGGFDTHSNTLMVTDGRFGALDEAFGAFREEMIAKGIWDSVVLMTVSDFARTLNPNGNDGVDHAWGGNHVMMGGSVKGGQIHGEYPDDLTDFGERMLTRGRAIPTMGWEKMFKPVAEWFGCTEEEMSWILPNMDSFTRPEYWTDHSDVFTVA